MSYRKLKQYIDAKLSIAELISKDYALAIKDISDYMHDLESKNICAYCDEAIMSYPHPCNGFIALSRDVRVWSDDCAPVPFRHCIT